MLMHECDKVIISTSKAHLAQGWEIMVIIQGCGELYMWVIVYASPLGMDHGVDRGSDRSMDRKTRNVDRRTGPQNFMSCF